MIGRVRLLLKWDVNIWIDNYDSKIFTGTTWSDVCCIKFVGIKIEGDMALFLGISNKIYE